MPKFSIIVPIYNVEKYVNKCVDSILAQSYEDFELILVDDGSTDGCPEICDLYQKSDTRVKVIHKENGGLSSARNAGLDKATGEFVWFVDGDDCVNPKSLEILLKYTKYSCDIIKIGNTHYEENEFPDFQKRSSRFSHFVGLADKKAVCKLAEHACSTQLLTYVWRNIFRLSFLKENSLRFEENLCYAEDSAFDMKSFLLADGIYFADDILYGYCNRKNSISKNRSKDFDIDVLVNFTLYDKLRDEEYEKHCQFKSDEYYKDAGIFIIKTTYIYALLNRLYMSRQKNSFLLFKKISSSPLIKKAFGRFDIKELKSKSLDWYMLYFVSKKMYFLAFLIYRFFLF